MKALRIISLIALSLFVESCDKFVENYELSEHECHLPMSERVEIIKGGFRFYPSNVVSIEGNKIHYEDKYGDAFDFSGGDNCVVCDVVFEVDDKSIENIATMTDNDDEFVEYCEFCDVCDVFHVKSYEL